LVIISRRLDLCTILVFGSLPNHTALDLFILCVYQPWNDQFRRELFVDLPDACIMRSSLLFRSIGRKGPYCRRPLHSHCSCSAAEAASLADADATSYCFFSSRDLAGRRRRRCRYFQVTPSMKLLSTLIEDKSSDGEVHGVQGISSALRRLFVTPRNPTQILSAMYLDVVPPSTLR
jgi:hypothetical protein